MVIPKIQSLQYECGSKPNDQTVPNSGKATKLVNKIIQLKNKNRAIGSL